MIGPKLQVIFPPRDAAREDAWLRAYCSVASAFNAKEPDCLRYADACLKAFDTRFPHPGKAYASAIEARRAAAENTDAVHESATRQGDAQ